ncbi:MAG: HDOD domain-containing protein [Candidatus Scalindua sediminis]|nr:HDOD domain-containing protein [Candidatus Scalindua sediminis]
MRSKTIAALTSKMDSIPTLPTVAFRVIEITADPDSSANDLMNVISPDVSLTTKILKIANSPFYGLTRNVDSLQHAITILGFQEVRTLVISTVVFESFKNIERNAKFDIRKFWKHSLVCGLAAKIIATDLGNKSNEFFVAGLIHDIGKLVIYITLPDEFSKVEETASTLKLKFMNFQIEESILGITHDEVGLRLLEKWMFPENLLTAVGFHHRPQETDKKSLLPIVTHIADMLAHIYEMQADGEGEGNLLKVESLCPGIIKMAKSYGIEWNEADLNRLQQAVTESVAKETDTLSLFF